MALGLVLGSLSANNILSLVISFTLLVSASSLRSGVNNGITAAISKQREFDYFVFALQWPGTFCQKTRKCCKTNGCCRSSNAPMEFTIHGLWPDYNDGSWPACCTDSEFDMKEVSTLRNALDKYWPSLSCGLPSTCYGRKGLFWAHEKVLSEAGYVASNSEKYPLGGIITAIENAFHASPLIICSNGAVKELRLCFYKDFKPRECVITPTVATGVEEKVTYSRRSCPQYVSLPIYASSGIKSCNTLSQLQMGAEAL